MAKRKAQKRVSIPLDVLEFAYRHVALDGNSDTCHYGELLRSALVRAKKIKLKPKDHYYRENLEITRRALLGHEYTKLEDHSRLFTASELALIAKLARAGERGVRRSELSADEQEIAYQLRFHGSVEECRPSDSNALHYRLGREVEKKVKNVKQKRRELRENQSRLKSLLAMPARLRSHGEIYSLEHKIDEQKRELKNAGRRD